MRFESRYIHFHRALRADSLVVIFQHLRIIAHADWSKDPAKCWLAIAARRADGGYEIHSLDRAANAGTLLARLGSLAGTSGSVLAGFDFPIGLPETYARLAGIDSFLDALPVFGMDQWADFYKVACDSQDISCSARFIRTSHVEVKRVNLTTALNLEWHELYRQCEQDPTQPARCLPTLLDPGRPAGRQGSHTRLERGSGTCLDRNRSRGWEYGLSRRSWLHCSNQAWWQLWKLIRRSSITRWESGSPLTDLD